MWMKRTSVISRETVRSQHFAMEGNWDADLLCISTVGIGMYFSCKSQQGVNTLSWKQHFSAAFCFKYFEGSFSNFFFPSQQKNSLPVFHGPQGGELHDLIGHYLSLLQFLSCHTACFLTYAKRNNVGMHPFWL